ncbi:MAG: bi-domain-containing oxidoreductase [Candidatus Methylomirabilales bacterium]
MRGVFRRNDGSIVVEEVAPPSMRTNGVIVRVAYSLISSGTEASTEGPANRAGRLGQARMLARKVLTKITEEGLRATVEAVKKNAGSTSPLNPLGYSAAGTVVEVAKGLGDLRPRDRVACAGTGYASHQELIFVPKHLLARVPEGVPLMSAAFSTLGSIALHGVRQAQVQLGEAVLVIGLGLVGQLSVQILKAAGCRVIGSDFRSDRVELARGLGLDQGLTPGPELVAEIQRSTRGIGADAVLVCADTRSNDPIRQAMEASRQRGRIVVVGNVGLDLDRQLLYEKELVLTVSRSYGPGRYDLLYESAGIDYPVGYVRWTEQRNLEAFLRLLAEGNVTVDPLIGLEVPLEEAPKGYDSLQTEPRPIAVLIRYREPGEEAKSQQSPAFRPRSVGREVLTVGVIGCGSFAQAVHLPNLQRIAGYRLRAVVAGTAPRAQEAAKRFGAEYSTTDYREVLADDGIDLVLITTRHHLHLPIALDAARVKKAIFLEKPMALSWEGCLELARAVREAGVPFTVGFNRRYSPLAINAKELVLKKTRPYFIVYRVNAGPIPRDHWVHDPETGGGRIIGEACHFFDFFNFLVGREAREIAAQAIPPDGSAIAAPDNLVATICYQDGSLAVLLYNSLGNQALPKERIEVFAGGGILVLDDFRRLTPYGFDENEFTLRAQDKGLKQELQEFLNRLKGEASTALTIEDALEASRITFQVHDLVAGGRPGDA